MQLLVVPVKFFPHLPHLLRLTCSTGVMALPRASSALTRWCMLLMVLFLRGWKRRMQFRLQGQRQLTSWKLGFNSVNDSRRVSRAVVSPSFSCNHDRKQVLFMPAWLYTIQDFMLCRRQQYAVGFLCVDVRFLCIDVGSPCLSVSCTTCPCNPSHPMT